MIEAILKPVQTIAEAMQVDVMQVQAAVHLLDNGATVPFIARYRKEETGSLNDVQLRYLAERLYYLRELEERRAVILEAIRQQDKLTPELENKILLSDTKARLEDLYLPFKPKRKTKATTAKDAGLEPLATDLYKDSNVDPEVHAARFICAEKGINTVEEALEGARHILMEQFAEDAELINILRQHIWDQGVLTATESKTPSKKKEIIQKYHDYFNFKEPLKKIPSHRALALFRGRRENVLQLNLLLPDQGVEAENYMTTHLSINGQSQKPCDHWLMETLRLTWKTKLLSKLESELFAKLRDAADEEAIKVFASNLKDLLLAAPAGPHVTLGLDPGIRTGVKAVVVDTTGKLLDYTTIFPFPPQNEWHQSITILAKMACKFQVNLISIGNGTASRDTEKLISELTKMYPDLKLKKMVVSEAGASVYSASELATKELPEVDVSIRGAVSIARRLQDPLAELVKIDPKSIGVGQYQHDVNQSRLARSLKGVVEDCVNVVGVDVNTASPSLLAHVAGMNEALAKNIVEYRDAHGAFANRESLKKVPRMGDKTFQQAAGFLRILQGDNPLDASGVHPETYPIVEKILSDLKTDINALMGNKAFIQTIPIEKYTDEERGLITLKDILMELEKPGRDPRPEFKTVSFKEGVDSIEHLENGMILEGVVSNVTNFGAFVDIGVHQDGLVHISSMTNKFIKDPRSIVKAGDIIKVKVIEIDKERKRIGLSMKLQEIAPVKQTETKSAKPVKTQAKQVHQKKENKKPLPKKSQKATQPEKKSPLFNTTMADALAKLKSGIRDESSRR